MQLATLIQTYRDALETKYAKQLLPGHRHALNAITRCRTPAAGEVLARCTDCGGIAWRPCSCGHRACPRCQHHEASQWLHRQQDKLLPVDYFLVTFTLPAQLRALAWNHQHQVYAALFWATRQTLRLFGLDPKQLGADIGMTAILHTHSRRLTYHPHLHVVVPGGGVDQKQRRWKRTRYRYLFNAFALAKLFRGKFLHRMARLGLRPPPSTPESWVVDCRHAGRGNSALQYLSRYLYRGVIRESNILFDRNGWVTFQYVDGKTGETRTESLPGADFLWRVIQHVLPRGFHRVRDYGFLHHNARRTLQLIQLTLQVTLKPKKRQERPAFCCPACGAKMDVIKIYPPHRINHNIRPGHGPPTTIAV